MDETAEDLRAELYCLVGEIRDAERQYGKLEKYLYSLDFDSDEAYDIEYDLDDLSYDIDNMYEEKAELENRIKELESV